MMNKKSKTGFWVINLSNRNLRLHDLNYTLKANASVNLLELKGVSYTIPQLEASATSGSLFKKRHMIKITSTINNSKPKLKEAYDQPWPNQVRAIALDPSEFEEVPLFDDNNPFISEEKFADQFSDDDDAV